MQSRESGGGELPAVIGRLKGLRVLVCDVCGLDSVPPELAHLARLETLRLVRKQLAALPGVDVPRAASATTPSPGPLRALKELALADNQLFELPPLLALARALRALDLAECEREHERRACARACGTRGPFV